MDINIKQSIDDLIQEISKITDLTQKNEAFHYIMQQADFCIWSLEEEQRQFENSGNY